MSFWNTLTDVAIVRASHLAKLQSTRKDARAWQFLRAMPQEQHNNIVAYWDQGKAQHQQDIFALASAGFKKGGYFVEFGATDGVLLSNSWLLEKEFGWSGILSEPARVWHKRLPTNRACHIETDCVWSKSGDTLQFHESKSAVLSTISDFKASDRMSRRRRRGKSYEVSTITLNDLLAKYEAPKVIDFLSVDTEGSEFEILRNFDFSAHEVRGIAVEHNQSPLRADLYELLTKVGYTRVLPELSSCDDWYVLPGKTTLA